MKKVKVMVKNNGDIDCSLSIASSLENIDESLKKIAKYLEPVKLNFDCIQAKTAEIDPHFGVPVEDNFARLNENDMRLYTAALALRENCSGKSCVDCFFWCAEERFCRIIDTPYKWKIKY